MFVQQTFFFSQLHFKVSTCDTSVFDILKDFSCVFWYYVNVYQIKREGIIQLSEQNLFWKQNTILPINNFPSDDTLLLTKGED